ncbi:MAG: cellulase family glycosylhydrolase [Lachnospiraceae bacterium]
MRKKMISLFASAVLALGLLSGCGNADAETGSTAESTQQETTSGTQEETVPSAQGETTSDTTAADSGNGAANAIEMAHMMGNGINLGNTMEAYGRASVGVGADTSVYETFWGAPVTTPEMVAAMKEAGFDTLRIPVAWTNAMQYESGDYTIGEDYLDRVEEIINYALDADMYVIVNDHWDGGWWGMFGSAKEETRQEAMELYVSMWTQIATRYEKYSDKLIFESGNEELGFRLNDTDVAADSGTLSDADCYVVTNQINQAFVDTIRSTGGNNADRFLLIAGFGTHITNTCKDEFRMPTDTVEDRLLLSVHYYDPSGYCLWNSQESWGSKTEYEDMQAKLSMLQKFTEQGYGIIIGEYGVLEQQNGLRPDTVKYTESFLDLCDLYGYCPVLWDTNVTFNRRQGKILFDEVAQMYLDHSFAKQSEKTLEEIQEAAQADFAAALAEAPEAAGVDENTAVAWIMYTSSDWGIQYSVGDVYSPDSKTAGIVATDVEITGEGTYTVSLDFTGTSGGYASGVTFSAVGIANGEILYPGYCIEIKEVLINGEPYKLTGRPYTASDDKICTRVNLYNAWVTAPPGDARTASGNAMYVSPCVLDAESLGNVETIEVTFDYVPGK